MVSSQPNGTGMLRRQFLQVGFSGFLGFGLAELFAGQASAARPARRFPAGKWSGPGRRHGQ